MPAHVDALWYLAPKVVIIKGQVLSPRSLGIRAMKSLLKRFFLCCLASCVAVVLTADLGAQVVLPEGIPPEQCAKIMEEMAKAA